MPRYSTYSSPQHSFLKMPYSVLIEPANNSTIAIIPRKSLKLPGIIARRVPMRGLGVVKCSVRGGLDDGCHGTQRPGQAPIRTVTVYEVAFVFRFFQFAREKDRRAVGIDLDGVR